MNKILLAFKLSFISLLLLTSCSKDDLTNETNSPVAGNGATPSSILAQQTSNQEIAKVTTKEVSQASVLVNVVDEFGAKVNGATVTISDNSLDTQNGVVIFSNIDLNKEYVGVKITHPEFITAIKNFTPSGAGVYNLEFKLFKGEKKTFSATSGQEITFESGVALDFSNTSIVNANGSIYQGTVNVNTYYHNPSDADYLQALPGALVGVDGEEISALITEGMITVDLTNTAGEEVFVNEGASVKVTMPADANAPATIDLWHLNEKYGIWTKTGTAVKNGAVYEFEVNHFSTYNLDVPVDALEEVEFVVLSNDNSPLQNVLLELYVDGAPQFLVQGDISANFSIFNAPEGEYQLRAISCETNKTVFSNIVKVQQSDTYEFVIELTEDIASKVLAFSANLINCSNQFNSEDVLTFTLFKGTSNERVILTNNDSFNSYYADILICDFDTVDTLDVEVNYNNGEYIGIKTFFKGFENDALVFYSNERRDVSICSATGGAVAELDSSLEAYIRQHFGFSDNYVITTEFTSQVKQLDLQSITHSDDEDVYFEKLDFNQIATYFPNLESLSVRLESKEYLLNEFIGEFLNFERISSLKKLKKLTLYNGSINDIAPVASLANLTELALSDNKLTDLSKISQLNNLKVLSIYGNPEVKNFNFLNNLTQLEDLSLSSMKVTDFGFFNNLMNLKSVYLSFMSIKDLSFVSMLTNVEELSLLNNDLSDISPLSLLTNLTWLNLQGNNISGLSPLSQLTNLNRLNLQQNNISDISLLSQLTNLTWLDLQENNISDISAIEDSEKFVYLNLSYNPISDISMLSNFTSLEFLYLFKTNIADLAPLSGLSNLINLGLGGNSITQQQVDALQASLPSTVITFFDNL